jgi:ADP-heptose:LPS heptosyltransferase
MSRPTALALRALGLGDYLTGLPALTLLRRALPEHELVLAAPAALAPLVELTPAVDRLFPVGELQSLSGFGRPVDVAVDLHGKGPASRRLVEELGPARVVGFAHRPSGREGPQWQPDEHEVTRWCRLVQEAFETHGRQPTVDGLVHIPHVTVPQGVSVVHPGAASGSRRWPAERFTAVARWLRSAGHDVVVTGGAAEHRLVETVAVGSGARCLVDLTLSELAALVAAARVVVCGDTGIAHLASAFGTRSVVLFGPVSPALWGPPRDDRHRVLWHGDGTGNPHAAEPDVSLLAIAVDEVVGALETLLLPAGGSARGLVGVRS